MRHIFIINPVAGNGKIQGDVVNNINNTFKDKKIDYEIYYTKYKGDIKNYLIGKCNDLVPTVFYACGGDGTLHEVVNGVNATGFFNHVSIGIIPCGSGNDFIKNFDNNESFQSIESQIQGQSVYLDLIKVENKYAVSVCNIGLDADAAFNMHKFKKIPFISGSTRYYLSVIYCLLNKLGKTLEVTVDSNKSLNGSYLLGVIANGHSYGGGYKCAPLAKVNDGFIDLCFINKISRLEILNLIGSYKIGEHLKNPKINKYVTYHKCNRVNIKSNETINICIDGEFYSYNDVELTAEKNALKFWLPKGAQIQSNLKEESKKETV
ncbi:MAG: diacylglycerol kinase family protein [Sedimentibacter sp.]